MLDNEVHVSKMWISVLLVCVSAVRNELVKVVMLDKYWNLEINKKVKNENNNERKKNKEKKK